VLPFLPGSGNTREIVDLTAGLRLYGRRECSAEHCKPQYSVREKDTRLRKRETTGHEPFAVHAPVLWAM
jgi:hypothetical protein